MVDEERKSGEPRMTIIRIVFAMLFLGSASFGGVYLFAEDATEALQAATFPAPELKDFLGGGYNLADLELLESTLYYVEEAYVEPQRIQPDKCIVQRYRVSNVECLRVCFGGKRARPCFTSKLVRSRQ